MIHRNIPWVHYDRAKSCEVLFSSCAIANFPVSENPVLSTPKLTLGWRSPIRGIFAVVCFGKLCGAPFPLPDGLSCPTRVISKVKIPGFEI